MNPNEMSATDALQFMRRGDMSCEELVRSCLERIEARDPLIRAWSFVDPQLAICAARERDKQDQDSMSLYGIPIGIKDTIETADMPTTYNSPHYQGHQTRNDAACVTIARESGGIIFGKTDTVEFAAGGRKALTRNPSRPTHTPGGSSSGSAAAVADFHVPIAFGTQTGGSIIRPASFTGTYAFKPSHGLVSAEGIKQYSHSLDTVGWFARSIADLQLVAAAFRVGRMEQPDGQKPIRVGLCRTPMWQEADEDAKNVLEDAAAQLMKAGVTVVDVELTEQFGGLRSAQDIIINGEGQATFLAQYLKFGTALDPEFRDKIENRMGITPSSLLAAYDLAAQCRPVFDAIFHDGLDALLTLAANGEAPGGLHGTGEWTFNAMWTLLHVPAIAIPSGRGKTGMPIGVQLVGPRLGDAGLLHTAASISPALDPGLR